MRTPPPPSPHYIPFLTALTVPRRLSAPSTRPPRLFVPPSSLRLSTRNSNPHLQDVDVAVKAARAAFEGEWHHTKTSQRGKYLIKLADLFEENVDLMSAIESVDNGKNLRQAQGDILAAAGCLRYYGGWADKIHGKVIETQSGTFNYTKAEPIGVCGQIIPYVPPKFSLPSLHLRC